MRLHPPAPALSTGSTVVTVVIFLCAKCFATWRVLPAFLVRCLWRSWEVVERALFGERQSPVPVRTVQRWHSRLAEAALAAQQALATSGSVTLRGVAKAVGLEASRGELAKAYAQATASSSVLAPLAALRASSHVVPVKWAVRRRVEIRPTPNGAPERLRRPHG